jgi:hypothetical protein
MFLMLARLKMRALQELDQLLGLELPAVSKAIIDKVMLSINLSLVQTVT